MSDRCDIILNTKNIRRVAFTVGFGLTLGKMTGDIVGSALDGFARGALKFMADIGNKTAQSICKEVGVKYNDKSQHEKSPKR